MSIFNFQLSRYSFAEMIASLGLKQLRQLKTEKELRKSRHSKAHDLLEMRVQERTAELRESEERLRCLSARLLAGQEEERKMIGREIHDSIGSSLAAVIFSLESARSKALRLDGEQIQNLLEIPISVTGDLKLYQNGRSENAVCGACIFFAKHPQISSWLFIFFILQL